MFADTCMVFLLFLHSTLRFIIPCTTQAWTLAWTRGAERISIFLSKHGMAIYQHPHYHACFTPHCNIFQSRIVDIVQFHWYSSGYAAVTFVSRAARASITHSEKSSRTKWMAARISATSRGLPRRGSTRSRLKSFTRYGKARSCVDLLLTLGLTWFWYAVFLPRHQTTGQKRGKIPFGNLANVHELQKRLKCKPYTWFLDKFKGRTPVEKQA